MITAIVGSASSSASTGRSRTRASARAASGYAALSHTSAPAEAQKRAFTIVTAKPRLRSSSYEMVPAERRHGARDEPGHAAIVRRRHCRDLNPAERFEQRPDLVARV